MSESSLVLVLQNKTSKIINGMANISIKFQKTTPFRGIFHEMVFYIVDTLSLLSIMTIVIEMAFYVYFRWIR